jgi:ATP-dependent Clp protease adaptor protein ClpS
MAFCARSIACRRSGDPALLGRRGSGRQSPRRGQARRTKRPTKTKFRFAPGAESAKVYAVPESRTHTSPELDTATALALDPPWRVVVLNDPVNLMSYVVLVFKRVFGFDEAKARKHMLEVHEKGRSVVWTGDREKAEAYAHTLQTWQLNAQIERGHG